MTDPLADFHSQTFAALLHTEFRVHNNDGAIVNLELMAVNEPQSPPGAELFSLLFRGPRSPRLAQQIHRLEHEKLGTFDLFITAVEGDAECICYEAVFHRLRKNQS